MSVPETMRSVKMKAPCCFPCEAQWWHVTVASYAMLNHFNDTVEVPDMKTQHVLTAKDCNKQHLFGMKLLWSSLHAFIAMAIKIYIAINNIIKNKCINVNVHSLATLLGTLASTGLDPFCLQNCINSSWHRFNEVLETLLRDFGPYWHDSITQLLQICRLHIHDENLSFLHIPKLLYWIEIWGLWRPFE